MHKSSGSWVHATIKSIDYDAHTANVEFKKDDCVENVPFEKMIAPLTPDIRPPPWNTIAKEVVKMVEKFILHQDQTCASPNKNDTVRKWVEYKSFETHAIHRLYTTRKNLYEKCKPAHPDFYIGFAIFKRLGLWYVRKGKRDTCLCGVWENMRLVLKGFNDQK